MEPIRIRKYYKCVKSPIDWNGTELFKRKGIYVIFADEPQFLYFVTTNGSIGRKYLISEVPKPFEKYFQEITNFE